MKELKGYPCSACDKERHYKTKQGADKSKGTNCNSCANSIKIGGVGLLYSETGERLCSKCKENPVGWNTYCDPCNVSERKIYWEEKMRFDRYGITKEIYIATLDEQKGSCYACSSTHKLCIDHDHLTGKVRGILCHNCNVSLGLLKDNKETLEKLIKYLNK